MKNFILIGAAGYIAPRHIQAIKDTGNNLIAIYDPHDSVGIIDRYFPECLYFSDFDRLDRHVYSLLRQGQKIDYVSIASPNYLHDAHCRWSLRIGADAICEKPLVLSENNIDALLDLEKETGNRVYGLYQLRYHDNTEKIFDAIKSDSLNIVNIDYKTPRGNWYQYSWKGDRRKSGGVETNIGCHLFDICSYFFGEHKNINILESEFNYSVGTLEFDNAKITWTLSTKQGEPKRVFNVNGTDISFDSGFTDLHTKVYQKILDGQGISIENHRESIKICNYIRNFKWAE